MEVRRYSRSWGWALPIAVASGAVPGALVFLAGNEDYRSSAGVGGLIYWATIGGLVGFATGLCALIGGYLFAASRGRRTSSTPSERISNARVGAAMGARAGWALLAIITEATTATFAVGLLTALVSLVCVGISAFVAGALVAAGEPRASVSTAGQDANS